MAQFFFGLRHCKKNSEMVIKIDTKNSGNNRSKLPLFQELMRDNYTFYQFVPQRDWFIFLQYILKAIKISDNREVVQFLNRHLPTFVQHRVPLEDVFRGFARLRSFVFQYILNDPDIPSTNKEYLITQLFSLFESMFRLIRDRFTRRVESKSEDGRTSQTQHLDQIDTMAFYVEWERFGNRGFLNAAFCEWTGIVSAGDFWQNQGWEKVIHPEDYSRIRLKLHQLIENRFPIYELTYRLKNSKEDWLHVIELGKIGYSKSGETEAFVGIIFEAGSAFKDQILNSEAAKILYSILSDQDETFLGYLKKLNKICGDLSRINDLGTFYEKIVDLAQNLVLSAEAGALLLRSAGGFTCIGGNGIDREVAHNKQILSQGTFQQISLDGDSASRVYRPILIEDPQLKNEILHNLFFTPPCPFELNLPGYDTSQMLAGLITVNNTPYAILVLNISDRLGFFDTVDHYLFEQYIQSASNVLTNIILSKRFQENRSNYQALFESSPLAVYILQDEKLKSFNKKFRELLGLGSGEAVAESIWNYVAPEDLPELRQKISRFNGKTDFIEHEFRLKTPRGEEIHCSGAFVRVQYKQKPAILCELSDVTRLRNLENQLLQSQKMETLGSLAAGIAHDFNNILGTIIPGAEMIMKNVPEGENQQRAKIIFRMAQRAASLTRQLLSYSQLSEEQAEIFNLNDLILESQDMLQKMTGPFIPLEYSLEGDLPDISGERNQVLQILVNLILNACDAMPESGTITISTRRKDIPEHIAAYRSVQPGSFVEFSVQDTGTGIAPEIRPKIFKPFFTTRAGSGGSGLGLSMVYSILRKHGGYITLESEEGNGSTFKTYLPVSVAKPREEHFVPPQLAAQQDLTLLIVDDEKYMREVLISMAKVMGYKSLEAASGQEAIEMYKDRQDSIDLVILDYAMPELSGKDTYRVLKKLNPAIRVILATGYGEQKGIEELTREQQVFFLPKPFTLEKLGQKIQSVFEPAQSR
jgi:PAS domain S-box-containing protein